PIKASVDNSATKPVTQSDKAPTFVKPASYKERPQPFTNASLKLPARSNQTDVSETALDDIDNKDTASHLEQAQNLLVSFRSIKYSDDDQEVDVSYEKAESRRLLNENIVLRRD